MIRSNTTSFITRFLVLIVSLTLVGADLVVLGQNSNSSTTTMQSDNTSAGNMNMSGGRRRRRRSTRRRRARRRGAAMNANAACGPMSENTNMASEAQENANMGSMSMTPVRTGRCDPNTQEQTDLSGTYTGKIIYASGERGMSGDATLTINGNDFTLTSGSSTLEGRVVAVTTCNYTAVTMRLGKDAGALPTLSLRAKRMGSSLSLASVSGESKQFSFNGNGGGGAMAGGTGGRRRRRGRRRRGGAMKMSGNACNPMAHAVTVQ